ncbi:uncharacterized protein [Garra rufa]|uniref:uncharacterized protein n=1 Tax=Garra rufa TaxID=137080 RepID=UPI003CCE8526
MANKSHLCLLGLIFLSSLLTGTNAENNAQVFISSGIKKKDTEIHERLSLGSDCSLNIKNITKEDYGSYTCQQSVNGVHYQDIDARVYLHVLHVSSSSSQTEISRGSSVTLSCQLYSYSYSDAEVSCDDWMHSEGIELFWVNQAGVKLTISDSRYQILFSSGHCHITLTTTLLNEDDNREWRCEVTHRDQVKTSATYTVRSSGAKPQSSSRFNNTDSSQQLKPNINSSSSYSSACDCDCCRRFIRCSPSRSDSLFDLEKKSWCQKSD